MQQDLQSAYPALRVRLVGINERGQEPGNANTTAGRTLPWLQDVDANGDSISDTFNLWQVTFRDVVILDGANVRVGVYNLTTHDLAIPSNYDTLRQMLVDAAMASQLPWQNAAWALDVDDNGAVTPRDALILINRLNDVGPARLPPPTTSHLSAPFYDVSGDNQITPQDALRVINYLNSGGNAAGSAEGERSGLGIQPIELPAIAVRPVADHPVSVADDTTRWTAAPHTHPSSWAVAQVSQPMSRDPWLANVDRVMSADETVDVVTAMRVRHGNHRANDGVLEHPLIAQWPGDRWLSLDWLSGAPHLVA